MTPTAFADKLSLVLKALSLSRGRLAAQLQVSKSQVSRWVSGANVPAPHNLIALTELVARRREGFTLLDWEQEPADIARRLGVRSADAEPSPPGEPGDELGATRAASRLEVSRDGDAYPGLYIGFRQSLRNSGALAPDIFAIWRVGERFLFRQIGVFFASSGEVFLLRRLLYFICVDDSAARDQMAFLTLSGVVGRKAVRLDGLLMSVSNEAHRTPGATPVVLQRLMDLPDAGAPPPEPLVEQIRARLRTAYAAAACDALAGESITAAVTPVVGAASPAGGFDHLLRFPLQRSLAVSEIGWTAAIEADVRRLRLALLDADDCFSLP